MNYEKKYNEALEKARQFSEHPLQEDSSSIVEYIFPELKESEDERIRKALITFFKRFPYDSIEQAGTNAKEAIAWLEKQGNPNPYSGTSFKYNGHTWGMCARENGVEVMMDRKLVASIKPDGDVESMVQSNQKRLANECKVRPANSATAANRQLYNRAILKILSNYVEKYPDTRFGQMLYNLGISSGAENNFYVESSKMYQNINAILKEQKNGKNRII